MPKPNAKEFMVFVSSFASGEQAAISAWRLNTATAKMDYVTKTTEVDNPFFLAVDPKYRFLYSIHEPGKFGGNPAGDVSAFSMDRRTGQLKLLNRESSGGRAACYLEVDKTSRVVLVANYSSGSVAALPILKDGRLGKTSCFIQHEGKSVNPNRQEGPHAHCIVIDPGNGYAFVADLGLDKVVIYKLSPARGKMTPNEQPFARVQPGAGPRHFAFHPSARFAYAINELDNTVTAFHYDERRGLLLEMQNISTLPSDFQGTTYCADVKVAPSGKFLYGTNRGHESIAMYKIDSRTGRLSLVGIEPCQGKQPQNLAITPDGSILLVANCSSDEVVVFRIDKKTGKLVSTGTKAGVAKPSCLMVVPA